MLIISRNLLKLFEIKLILVVIFSKREVWVDFGKVEGSHGPVEVSGPSTSPVLGGRRSLPPPPVTRPATPARQTPFTTCVQYKLLTVHSLHDKRIFYELIYKRVLGNI